MSDDHILNDEHLEEEEIDPAEVEHVTNSLADLMEKVESETIHATLHEAYEAIAELADWEEEEGEDLAQAA